MKKFGHSWVAGPMIKVSVLPFRLMCLEYGADVVFTEELSAVHLAQCVRVMENYVVHFRLPDGHTLFSTCPREAGRVILQLGVSEPDVAVSATRLVMNDIAGIDINMGCPKKFSTCRGMGASLLKNISKASSILKAVSNVLKEGRNGFLSCKIRLLESIEETESVIRSCLDSGADVVFVHGRHIGDRPSTPAYWPALKALCEIFGKNIVVPNGDFFDSESIKTYLNMVGNDSSLMLSRGALKSVWLFRYRLNLPEASRANLEEEAVKCLLRKTIETKCSFPTLKWVILEMVDSRDLRAGVEKAKTAYDIFKAFGLLDEYVSAGLEFEKVYFKRDRKRTALLPDHTRHKRQCPNQSNLSVGVKPELAALNIHTEA